MTATKQFNLGPFPLSDETPPVFLAEIGTFFNQDIDMAKQLLDKILAARDAVPHQPLILKTEILNNPNICLSVDYDESYVGKNSIPQKENYRQLIERKTVPLEEYARLFALIREADIPFIVSVYEPEVADFAIEQGACALKASSSNIVHIPLIRRLAQTGLPLIIDSGRSTIADIFNAVDTAQKAGCDKIIIEHSPDGHPALPQSHNLKMLQTLNNTFSYPVGLSDHYQGIEMLYLAIALGTHVLEKGVHLYPNDVDQDLSHTFDIENLSNVLETCYNCWLALGKPMRDLTAPIEGVLGSSQRTCLVARNEIQAGRQIQLEDVTYAFPCRGVPTQHWDLVSGWEVTSSIPAGQPIQWSDLRETHGS